MKKLLLFNCLILLAVSARCQDDLRGYWSAGEGSTIVHIDGDQTGPLTGKIVWLEKPTNKKGEPVTDRLNPDKSLRNQPIMGISMLENLTYSDGAWKGKLYSPKRGRKVDATLQLEDDNILKLSLSYRGFSQQRKSYSTEQPK